VRPVLAQTTIDALSISSDGCEEGLLELMSAEQLAAMRSSVVAPPPEYPLDEDGAPQPAGRSASWLWGRSVPSLPAQTCGRSYPPSSPL
jgi:hypothetical protein